MSLYKALNEEDAQKARYGLLEDGEYDAVVKVSTQKPSKSGNIMAELILDVFDKQGQAHEVKDWLVFSNNMLWKLKHFCESAGLEKEYQAEQFHPGMAVNQHVRVKIITEIGNEIPIDKLQGKPVGSRYPDRNKIEDYLVAVEKTQTTKALDEFINDEIPF